MLSSEGGGDCPFEYQLSPGEDIAPETLSAVFDGSGAASAFRPALSLYSQDGNLISRTFTEDEIAAGASAEVTFAPF